MQFSKKYGLKSIALLLCAGTSLVGCADYDRGREAYRSHDYELARQNLEPLAFEYHDAESQIELARLYMETEAPGTHAEKVQWLLNDAAGRAGGEAYYYMAEMYQDGYGVPKDGDKAADFYNKAYEYGYWRGHYGLARMYERGDAVDQDLPHAETLYTQLVRQHGYDRAATDLTRIKAERAVQNGDLQKAQMYWQELIKSGDDTARVELARLYKDNVTDGSKDGEILALLNEAKGETRGKAFFDLGRIYERGELKTVGTDGQKAAYYYSRAADQGYWRADYALGRMYDRGKVVPEDNRRAAALYRKVLENNDYEPARKALSKL